VSPSLNESASFHGGRKEATRPRDSASRREATRPRLLPCRPRLLPCRPRLLPCLLRCLRRLGWPRRPSLASFAERGSGPAIHLGWPRRPSLASLAFPEALVSTDGDAVRCRVAAMLGEMASISWLLRDDEHERLCAEPRTRTPTWRGGCVTLHPPYRHPAARAAGGWLLHHCTRHPPRDTRTCLQRRHRPAPEPATHAAATGHGPPPPTNLQQQRGHGPGPPLGPPPVPARPYTYHVPWLPSRPLASITSTAC
jgi:hypothetical protein